MRAVGADAIVAHAMRAVAADALRKSMLDRLANDCRCFADLSGNGGRKPFAAMSLCKDLQPLWLSWLTKSSRWPQRAAARSSQVCGASWTSSDVPSPLSTL